MSGWFLTAVDLIDEMGQRLCAAVCAMNNGLAIHDTINAPGGLPFCLTHVPSGGVIFRFPSKRAAFAAADRIQGLIDWASIVHPPAGLYQRAVAAIGDIPWENASGDRNFDDAQLAAWKARKTA